jgi:hypothetical protein
MRYLLIVVGLLGVLLGLQAVQFDPATRVGPLLVQAGAIFLAVGLATVDIVTAIQARRQQDRDEIRAAISPVDASHRSPGP